MCLRFQFCTHQRGLYSSFSKKCQIRCALMYKDQTEEDEVCEIHYFLQSVSSFWGKEPRTSTRLGSTMWGVGTKKIKRLGTRHT
jgi:hypothetical protein